MKTKFVDYTWWICGVIGLIWAVQVFGTKDVGMTIFIGLTSGLIFGWLIGALIDYLINKFNSSVVSPIVKKIEDKKEEQKIIRDAEVSMSEYNDAKYRFQFFSTETLIEKMNSHKQEDMIRLALEEELVGRGILDYSPMHEKLDALKKYFKTK